MNENELAERRSPAGTGELIGFEDPEENNRWKRQSAGSLAVWQRSHPRLDVPSWECAELALPTKKRTRVTASAIAAQRDDVRFLAILRIIVSR